MSEQQNEAREAAIEGLRYIVDSPSQENGGFHPNTVQIAKDALTVLAETANHAAEIERLNADLEANREHQSGMAQAFCQDMERLEGEVKRLRAALKEYEGICTNCFVGSESHDENGEVDMLDEIGQMICGKPVYSADEALNPKERKNEQR